MGFGFFVGGKEEKGTNEIMGKKGNYFLLNIIQDKKSHQIVSQIIFNSLKSS